MNKKIILVLIAIIAIILVVGGLSLTNAFKQEPKLNIVTNGTVHTNTTFLVKSTDLNNTSIANESISIEILDNESNTVIDEEVKTNEYGEASIELTNVSEGNYTVNVTFEGNDEFKECTVEQDLEIVEDVVDTISSDDNSTDIDDGAFYSEQAGRTIYTGEVQLGPDGHYWKHLGNNEWVEID
ncbi:MAG: hypothetical protein IJQ68_02780 [Methanobrevibacter sp.]|uniref:hypothetical protein n=1 Tax=Methanobrevibacter sp. TaxID=66852 RepID=UPI0025CF7CA7|nr:hypothetical protein [Methanobrevibacter sp.]MBR0270899.1 hypothetical protein [Methanobrevibacter sp.]